MSGHLTSHRLFTELLKLLLRACTGREGRKEVMEGPASLLLLPPVETGWGGTAETEKWEYIGKGDWVES